MISIVSVGISECKDLASIPCARDDARKVFDTFHDVLSSGFQDHNSICLFDITQEQFICVLKAIMPAIGPNSSLILYFSCHAKTDEYDDLCLLLADGSRDSLRTSRLFDEIKRKRVKENEQEKSDVCRDRMCARISNSIRSVFSNKRSR